jgi:hypothetical protein
MADKVESVDCVGVIFQFNEKGVLFEFPDGSGEDTIGVVKASNIKINKTSFIPANACSSERLSEYLEVGGEIRCTVTKDTKLPPYEYVEEEEEFDGNGDLKTTSKTVTVNPEWIANQVSVL